MRNYFFSLINECSDDIEKILKSKDFNIVDSNNNDIKISIGIMSFNEERCIERCVRSVEKIADEVIIIDTGSTDNTIKIIKEKFPGIKLLKIKWENNFSYIRNELINNSSFEWVFQIDADEYLDEKDSFQLKNFIKMYDSLNITPAIISPKIVDHTGREYFITNRIFKKNSNLKYFGLVHEELRYKNKALTSYISINVKLHHDGYREDIIVSKNKYNRNFKLLKQMLELEPENIRWYYFLVRDGILLNLPIEYIESIIFKGLYNLEDDPNNYKIGLLVKLLDIKLNYEDEAINEYIEYGKDNAPQCIDIYYYELFYKYISVMKEVNRINSNSIIDVSNIENEFSILNNSYDHFFSLWGWIYFSVREYDLAFSMFNKIKYKDERKKVEDELEKISEKIKEFKNF